MSGDKDKLLQIMASLESDYAHGKISREKYIYFRSKYEDKLNALDAREATNRIRSMHVDKAAEEQRKRVEKRAEVFTPSWICNRQNNLVDAAWFNWNKQDSSPFNMEVDKFDPEFRTIAENGGGHGQ